MDKNTATFYFCDLKTNHINCPKMHECKRYELVKDVPYNEYEKLGFAKLHNICNQENRYQMFMEIDNKPNKTNKKKV